MRKELPCLSMSVREHVAGRDNRRHGDSNHDEAATSTTPEFLELENPNSARKRTPRPSSRETGIHRSDDIDSILRTVLGNLFLMYGAHGIGEGTRPACNPPDKHKFWIFPTIIHYYDRSHHSCSLYHESSPYSLASQNFESRLIVFNWFRMTHQCLTMADDGVDIFENLLSLVLCST
uniref:Uncharacterized protein n=1 Tax=Coccidioides posadasii RMSCC 3488 TaxID=454284 RepID=A0A0J6EUJ2_COCPO|nr:hypothetical protein CPAG_00543 [Coccidioides posadasii RMSCC 3488]